MKRQVLFILIGALLCFIAGPTPTNAADTYCPPMHVPPGGICDCTVFNYGADADTGVVIQMYDDTGTQGYPVTNTVQPGISLYTSWPYPVYTTHWTVVGCKVKGTGKNSRVSIQCYPALNEVLNDVHVSYAFAECRN